MVTIEICTGSYRSAMIAQKGGAHRIELCANLENGGTTPSKGCLDLVRNELNIPIMVLIRPRGGDFVYSKEELRLMEVDIKYCKSIGMDGVVTGVLNADGSLPEDILRNIVEWASPMKVVFHRAFDKCINPTKAIDQLSSWGYQRLLTSGRKTKVINAIPEIKRLLAYAAGRIEIMPGSGINAQNILQILDQTNVRQVHLSARELIKSPYQVTTDVSLSAPCLPEEDHYETSLHKVQEIVSLCKLRSHQNNG